MIKRTPKGNITATSRKKHGSRGKGVKKGSFPIGDKVSANSALRLRGHARTKAQRRNIITRARKYLPEKASKAWKQDSKDNKI